MLVIFSFNHINNKIFNCDWSLGVQLSTFGHLCCACVYVRCTLMGSLVVVVVVVVVSSYYMQFV